MSRTHSGGKPVHRWTPYFHISNKMKNKSNRAAQCRACMERSDSTAMQVAELTNKRSICRAHLKGCENLKSTLSIQQWEGLIKEILDEEQLEKAKRRNKEKHVENLGINNKYDNLLI